MFAVWPRGRELRRRCSPRFGGMGWTCIFLWSLCASLTNVVVTSEAIAQEGPTFPALSGRVVDNAGLLDPSQVAALDTTLAAHEAASSNQIVIVTVPSLQGYDIADFANRLGRHWAIGTAEKNNGVLLVVAPDERDVRIEVGYGLEGALTDALSRTIIQREILPAFREGDFASGIEKGTQAIIATIEGEYTAPPAGTSGRSQGGVKSSIGNLLPLIFIAMVAIPEVLRRTGASRAANGAFPAGFGGLMGTLLSNSLLIGLGIAVAVFIFMYFIGGKGSGGSGGTARRRRRVIVGSGGFGGGGGGFGGGGGGGFGGGGGGFGGGGASGSW